jgi:hypothetical protein
VELAPRVPSQRDPLVDQGAMTTRAWFRFFQLLQNATENAALTQYTVVQNTTGTTIPKGAVVGFVGVGSNNVLSVAPYLADGSSPSLYILGVMAEELPDSGAAGLCCVWGNVSGIDTSAFSVGDVLYASPTVAGAFTNVKPTAPDNVIPIAAVLVDSATAGDIFVRPTIEQQKYYGEFTLDSTVSLTAATPYAVVFNSTEIADGVALGSPASRVVFSQSGLYSFGASVQFNSTTSSAKTGYVWFRKNGTDIPNSARIALVSGAAQYAIAYASEFFSMQAGDYMEIMVASNSANLAIGGFGGNAYVPAAPAVVLAVSQIQQ